MSVQLHPKDLFTVPESIRSLMMIPGAGARPKTKDKSSSVPPNSHHVAKQKSRSAGSRGQASSSDGTGRQTSVTTSARDEETRTVSASSIRNKSSGHNSLHSAAVAKARTPTSGRNSSSRGGAPGVRGRGQCWTGGQRSGSSSSSSSRRYGSARSKAAQEEDEVHDYDEYAEAEQDVRFINIPSSSEDQLGIEFVETPRETSEIVPKEILQRCQETNYQRVYEINLSSSQISHITNLESFTKLRVLDLSCNYIKAIDNLHYCTELRELKLYDNHIWEIGSLDKLKELCHLQLQHNRIKSIGKGLQSSRKLKQLRVDNNYISRLDVKELAGCSQLVYLDVSSNRLDNIGAVSCLPNLEELYARNNRLRGISDISRCKKLQEVDFSHNRLTDISGLKGLPGLTILHLAHNQLTGLRSLGKLKVIQEIYMSHNRLNELQLLPELYPALQILDVTDNCVETWQEVCSLKDLSELVELFIVGNPFCSEHGPKPNYHRELHTVIPQLEVLDGAQLRRPSSRSGTPLMRPMSANSVVSARQVESQLLMMESDLISFENNLSATFESLRANMNQLPVQSSAKHDPSTPESMRPKSRCGKRSRIQLAKEFASQNFGDESSPL